MEIGDEGQALKLILNVLGADPRRPIRELVENAACCDAKVITVIVNKRNSDPYVMCRDNGRGMTTDFLLQLPKNIHHSIKRRMEGTSHHGIGLLGYNIIGSKLRIISRARGSTETGAIELIGLKQYRQIEVERSLPEPGTEIYIYGIDKDEQLLDVKPLAEYLALEFEQDLREAKFKLEIRED
jgi:HSP90 family molecular chaperone